MSEAMRTIYVKLKEASANKRFSERSECWVVTVKCDECGGALEEEYSECKRKIMECLDLLCISCAGLFG